MNLGVRLYYAKEFANYPVCEKMQKHMLLRHFCGFFVYEVQLATLAYSDNMVASSSHEFRQLNAIKRYCNGKMCTF